MITHLASGALITPEEEKKLWIQRQVFRAVGEITGDEYRPPRVRVKEPKR